MDNAIGTFYGNTGGQVEGILSGNSATLSPHWNNSNNEKPADCHTLLNAPRFEKHIYIFSLKCK
jgi:hypothetical protein